SAPVGEHVALGRQPPRVVADPGSLDRGGAGRSQRRAVVAARGRADVGGHSDQHPPSGRRPQRDGRLSEGAAGSPKTTMRPASFPRSSGPLTGLLYINMPPAPAGRSRPCRHDRRCRPPWHLLAGGYRLAAIRVSRSTAVTTSAVSDRSASTTSAPVAL